MKSKTCTRIIAALLFALAIPLQLAAQDSQVQKHHHYRFTDLGVFGISNDPSGGGTASGILSARGIVVGGVDTSIPDPNYPNTCLICGPNPLIAHAFKWKDGSLTDLGALPGVNISVANWISPEGLVAGFSENGAIDPLYPGVVPEINAVLWKDGEIVNLGTIEGGYESNAFVVNDRGQVAGVFLNTIPDPFSPFGLQLRAFLWQNGVMEDLGTLGGPEAEAYFMNESGQVAGNSFLSSIPNSATGIPTLDPFLWTDDKMIDLGTLGGTIGIPNAMNNRGWVVGQSNLAGNLTAHPFLWNGKKMIDLGTFGGDSGGASWLNEAGDVVGSAFTKNPQVSLAFLWKDGVLTSLGTVRGDACSNALGINSTRQVVGASAKTCDFVTDERHAFLWENNQMIDLNIFLPPNSDLQQLTDAYNINDRGEIVGLGVPPGCGDEFGCGHVFVLIPCDENHPNVDGCDYGLVDSAALALHGATINNNRAPSTQPRLTPEGILGAWRTRPAHSYRRGLPGTTTSVPDNSGELNVFNAASAISNTEPAPTNLTSFAFNRGGFDDIVRLGWTNNSTDDDSFHIERCAGAICTNFIEIAQTGANVTKYNDYFQFEQHLTFRYRVRAHSPSGYSSYSNIRTQTLP